MCITDFVDKPLLVCRGRRAVSGSTALLLGALLQAGAAGPVLVSHGQKGTQAA